MLGVFQAWTVKRSMFPRLKGEQASCLPVPAQFQSCLFPLSSHALSDDECRAVWPQHNRRPRSLNSAGQQTPTLETSDARPPDFPGAPKTKSNWLTPLWLPSSYLSMFKSSYPFCRDNMTHECIIPTMQSLLSYTCQLALPSFALTEL